MPSRRDRTRADLVRAKWNRAGAFRVQPTATAGGAEPVPTRGAGPARSPQPRPTAIAWQSEALAPRRVAAASSTAVCLAPR